MKFNIFQDKALFQLYIIQNILKKLSPAKVLPVHFLKHSFSLD